MPKWVTPALVLELIAAVVAVAARHEAKRKRVQS